jgi:hypothetical protein
MKVMSSRYTAEGRDTVRPLILTQRTAAPGLDTPIIFQETCLGLACDRSQIVVRRYFERYSPDCADWVEYIHSIPTAEFIHWIMTHGQLRIECSENTPKTHVHA